MSIICFQSQLSLIDTHIDAYKYMAQKIQDTMLINWADHVTTAANHVALFMLFCVNQKRAGIEFKFVLMLIPTVQQFSAQFK